MKKRFHYNECLLGDLVLGFVSIVGMHMDWFELGTKTHAKRFSQTLLVRMQKHYYYPPMIDSGDAWAKCLPLTIVETCSKRFPKKICEDQVTLVVMQEDHHRSACLQEYGLEWTTLLVANN